MKTIKLVVGILLIVASAFVLFQSCAAGMSNSLAENGEVSGSAGLIVAIVMLAGGIVMIVTRNGEKKGGDIACIIMFLLATLMGFANAGTFSDLKIWSGACAISAVISAVSLWGKKKNQGNDLQE